MILDKAGPPQVRRISPPIVQISEVERRQRNYSSEVTVTLNRNDRNCFTFLAQHFLAEEGMATIPLAL